jgi:hypothetical protein
MLVVDSKRFTAGVAMMAAFFVVLALMFSPLFHGHNAFRAADTLFNSIAKGSSYAIPRLREEALRYRGDEVQLQLHVSDAATASAAERLLAAAGIRAAVDGSTVELRGDLGVLLEAALDDADALFTSDEQALGARDGAPDRASLYAWWSVLRPMQEQLRSRGRFAEARFVEEVRTRAVEMSYNFHGIEPARARAHLGILVLSLAFYVAYTLWWGYAIMLVFDGLGLQMKPAKRREA